MELLTRAEIGNSPSSQFQSLQNGAERGRLILLTESGKHKN